jgi:hypothetical protein
MMQVGTSSSSVTCGVTPCIEAAAAVLTADLGAAGYFQCILWIIHSYTNPTVVPALSLPVLAMYLSQYLLNIFASVAILLPEEFLQASQPLQPT